jgi:acyl carrier protein
MERMQIESKLCHIIAQVLGKDMTPEKIPRGPGLLEQLYIDSLMALQIIVLIEQQFGIVIEDDDFVLEMLDALDRTVAYIEQARGQQSVSPEKDKKP